jgi:hypothetical protein
VVIARAGDREIGEDEAALLAFFDVLLGLRAGVPSLPPGIAGDPGGDLLEMAAERAKHAALHFLARSGLTERTVLREGRATSGRLWDRRLNEGFVLRFGPGFFDFASMLARRLEVLRERKSGRKIVVAPSLRCGDMILYTLTWCALPKLGLEPENAEVALRALARSNPFTALHALEEPGDGRAPFGELLAPERVRLLEVTEASLEDAWSDQLQSLFPRRAGDARFGKAREAMATYVNALESAHRLDLAGPVLGALRRTIEPLAGADVRGLALRYASFRTIAARDEQFRSIAALFDVGRRLTRRYRELALARYGDDYYGEARAFVAVFERSFAGAAAENERIHRELVPVVGG